MVSGVVENIINMIKERLVEILAEPFLAQLPSKEEIDVLKEHGLVDEAEINKMKEETMEQMKDAIGETLNKFGSALTLLIDLTGTFAKRLAQIPAAIISTTPVGPGVSLNLIPSLFQSLKGSGMELSNTYDQVKSSVKELGLEDAAKEDPSGTISVAVGMINGFLALASTACLLVGVGCGDQKEASDPEIEPPIEPDQYEAEDCVKYEPKPGYEDIERLGKKVEWCKKFEHLSLSNDEILINPDERICNNCKHYRKI